MARLTYAAYVARLAAEREERAISTNDAICRLVDIAPITSLDDKALPLAQAHLERHPNPRSVELAELFHSEIVRRECRERVASRSIALGTLAFAIVATLISAASLWVATQAQ